MTQLSPAALASVTVGDVLIVRAARGDQRSFYEVTVTRLTVRQFVADRQVDGQTFIERFRRDTGRLIGARQFDATPRRVDAELHTAIVDWTAPQMQIELTEYLRRRAAHAS